MVWVKKAFSIEMINQDPMSAQSRHKQKGVT